MRVRVKLRTRTGSIVRITHMLNIRHYSSAHKASLPTRNILVKLAQYFQSACAETCQSQML